MKLKKPLVSIVFLLLLTVSVFSYTGSLSGGGIIPANVGSHELIFVSNGTHSVDANEDGIIDVAEYALNAVSNWNVCLGGICYNGDIGIGPTTPLARLTVSTQDDPSYKGILSWQGTALTLNGTPDGKDTFPYIQWLKDNERAMYLGWGNKSAKYLDMKLENGYDLAITGGNVGIGTTSPTAKLDIKSSGASYGGTPTLTIRDDINRGTLILESEGDNPTDFVLKNNGQRRWFISSRDSPFDYDLFIYNTDNSGTAIGPAVAIDRTTGNVGIGTTNPTEKLEVNGNIKSSGTICDTNGCIGSGGSSVWELNGNDAYYNTGDVGIGTNTPGIPLTVQADGPTLRLQSHGVGQHNYIEYYINGSAEERSAYVGYPEDGSKDFYIRNEMADGDIILQPNGNVGIGTMTPTQPLHLHRDANAATSILIDNPNSGANAETSIQFWHGATHLFNIVAGSSVDNNALLNTRT